MRAQRRELYRDDEIKAKVGNRNSALVSSRDRSTNSKVAALGAKMKKVLNPKALGVVGLIVGGAMAADEISDTAPLFQEVAGLLEGGHFNRAIKKIDNYTLNRDAKGPVFWSLQRVKQHVEEARDAK